MIYGNFSFKADLFKICFTEDKANLFAKIEKGDNNQRIHDAFGAW